MLFCAQSARSSGLSETHEKRPVVRRGLSAIIIAAAVFAGMIVTTGTSSAATSVSPRGTKIGVSITDTVFATGQPVATYAAVT
jgi:hypothetical protein